MKRALTLGLGVAVAVAAALGTLVALYYPSLARGSPSAPAGSTGGSTVPPVNDSFNFSGQLAGGSSYDPGVGFCGTIRQFQGSVPPHAPGILRVINPSGNSTVQTFVNFTGGTGSVSGAVGFHGKVNESFVAPSDGAFVVTLQSCDPFAPSTGGWVGVWLNYTNPLA